MEQALKLSEEIVSKLDEFLKSEKGVSFVAETKAAKDEDVGRFEMIITTEDIDRAGEMIKADSWELERYMLNPVVLWAHNYSELPVGVTETLEKIDGGKLKATGKFAPHEKAQTVRALYEGGYLKTSSVGFIPLEMQGSVITRAELLEWSFVPVPCNPYALSTLSARGINVDELVTKGLIVKEEEPAPEVPEAPAPAPTSEAPAPDPVPPVVLEAEEKEGRVLSKKNVALIEECIQSLGVATSALEALLSANNRSDEEDKSIELEGKTVETDDAFLKLREGLQGVASLVTEVLTDAKANALSRGIKVRRPN